MEVLQDDPGLNGVGHVVDELLVCQIDVHNYVVVSAVTPSSVFRSVILIRHCWINPQGFDVEIEHHLFCPITIIVLAEDYVNFNTHLVFVRALWRLDSTKNGTWRLWKRSWRSSRLLRDFVRQIIVSNVRRVNVVRGKTEIRRQTVENCWASSSSSVDTSLSVSTGDLFSVVADRPLLVVIPLCFDGMMALVLNSGSRFF